MAYYLSDGSKTYGPFQSRQIYQLLSENKISLFQLIFEDEAQQWIQLYQHPHFTTAQSQNSEQINANFEASRGNRPPTEKVFLQAEGDANYEMNHGQGAVSVAQNSQKALLMKKSTDFWEIQMDRGVSSPRTFLKMLEAIREKIVTPNHLIRKVGQKNWLALKDAQEFSEQYVDKVDNEELTQMQQKEHFRRKYERKAYVQQILVVADAVIEFNESVDISLGGCAFLSKNSSFEVGDLVSLYFKNSNHEFDTEFRMEATLVSKKIQDQNYKYAVQFVHIPYGFMEWYNRIA